MRAAAVSASLVAAGLLLAPSGPDVRRNLSVSDTGYSYSTWFHHGGAWVTAGHVLEESEFDTPTFAQGDVVTYGPFDLATVGEAVFHVGPPALGSPCLIRGYPAGSDTETRRRCSILMRRDEHSWIIEVNEPVVVGMSGSPVMAGGEVIGVLVTANSPTDLDGDGDLEFTADMVALSDVSE